MERLLLSGEPSAAPAGGAGGLRNEAARSAARCQRLVGARSSPGVAAGQSAAAAAVPLAASPRPATKLSGSARPGAAALLPTVVSSVVVLRRSAVMAARPGVAAGCCSSASSEATS